MRGTEITKMQASWAKSTFSWNSLVDLATSLRYLALLRRRLISFRWTLELGFLLMVGFADREKECPCPSTLFDSPAE